MLMGNKNLVCIEAQGRTLAPLLPDLSASRSDWHVVRAGSESAVLDLLGQYPVAVVIASYGGATRKCAELFAAIGALSPATIRMAIAPPQVDGRLPDSIDLVHRYLPHDCTSPQLELAIDRALRVWVRSQANKQLVQLVAGLKSLPTPPMLYFEIKEALDSPRGSLRTASRLIAKDPAVTAKILKLANSGLFAPARTVTDLDRAIGLLGSEMVLGIVLSVQLYDSLPVPGLNLDKLWVHSMAVSAMSRTIVMDETGDRQQAAAAGVAGLLHDVGQLILVVRDPARYFSIIRSCDTNEHRLVEIERERFGIDHARLGSYLLDLWGIPDEIVDTVEHHHSWRQSEIGPMSMTMKAVYMAEWLTAQYAIHKELLESCTAPEGLDLLHSSHAVKWWGFLERIMAQRELG
jgi:HD-like signal output (HDOD) protein